MGSALSGCVEFEEALAVVLEACGGGAGRARSERVELLEAAGRVLAEEVMADRDQPPFDRATRDGFAVRAEELAGGARLRVVGQVRAGEVWPGGALRAGAAVEIMTGAPVPEGADAVVMVEHVERAEGEVWAGGGTDAAGGGECGAAGERRRGRGRWCWRRGRVMGAAEIALAASCGCAELAVYRAAAGGDCGDGG